MLRLSGCFWMTKISVAKLFAYLKVGCKPPWTEFARAISLTLQVNCKSPSILSSELIQSDGLTGNSAGSYSWITEANDSADFRIWRGRRPEMLRNQVSRLVTKSVFVKKSFGGNTSCKYAFWMKNFSACTKYILQKITVTARNSFWYLYSALFL